MALFGFFGKRRPTPEELEKRSLREREWAEKAYRKGEALGERMGFGRKVEKVNGFANRYPRTFFAAIVAAVLACLLANTLLFNHSGTAERRALRGMPEAVGIAGDRRPDFAAEIDGIVSDALSLAERLEALTGNPEGMSRADSMEAVEIIRRIQVIDRTLGLSSGTPADTLDVERSLGRLGERMQEIVLQDVMTPADSVELAEIVSMMGRIGSMGRGGAGQRQGNNN